MGGQIYLQYVYERSIGTKIGDLEWPWTAKWPLFCVIFTEFDSFRAHCIKVVDKAITMDNLRLLPTILYLLHAWHHVCCVCILYRALCQRWHQRGVRGPAPTRKNRHWARLWPRFFLMYRSLCAPPPKKKLSLALYLLDSGAGTG